MFLLKTKLGMRVQVLGIEGKTPVFQCERIQSVVIFLNFILVTF